MRIASFLVIVLVLAAGCTKQPTSNGKQLTDSSSGSPSSSTGSFTTTRTLSPADSFSPFALWSNCTGFRATLDGPKAIFDYPPPPPGWENNTTPIAGSDLRFFTCDRISWGNFERGRVHMILDLFAQYFYPDACSSDASNLGRNLATWWFDDEEVARYVAQVYHANAFYAPIAVQYNDTGGVVDQTWAWGLEGKPKSHVRFIDTDVPMDDHVFVTHIVWFTPENQVYAMDFTQDWLVPSGYIDGTATHPSSGRLEDPMFYVATSHRNDFVARSEQYTGMEIGADFYRFGDLQCKQPLPP